MVKLSSGIPLLDTRHNSVYSQGHIPLSKNIPFSTLLNPDNTYKSVEELRKLLKDMGVDQPETQPIVSTCQRGITACILDVALRLIGNTNTSVYDGSYEEYSKKQLLEKPKP